MTKVVLRIWLIFVRDEPPFVDPCYYVDAFSQRYLCIFGA